MAKHNIVLHYMHIAFSSVFTQLCILICAVFVLFSGDLEVVLIPHSAHGAIIVARNVCFFFFAIELLTCMIIEEGYINSIYFYMDVIDLISLSSETSLIWNALLNYLDNISLDADQNVKDILLNSVYHEPGIGLDANAIKYLAFFRVISYLKIVRVAKVIEATKKLNGTVRKKIIKKSRKLAELLEKRRGSSNIKGRRNKTAQENELQFAVKYLSDLDKYKGEIQMNEVKNSSNVLISGRKSKNSESSPLNMKPNRISRDQTTSLKRQNNKFLTALNIFRKSGDRNNNSEIDKGKLNLNPFSLLLRRKSIFPATQAKSKLGDKDPLALNSLLQNSNRRSNFLVKKNSKGATITDRLNLLMLRKATVIPPSSPSKENNIRPFERSGRGSRFSHANKSSESSEGRSGLINLMPLQAEISDQKHATTPFLSNLLNKKVNFLVRQKTSDDPHKDDFRKHSIDESISSHTKREDSLKSNKLTKNNSELSDFYNVIDSKITEKLTGFNVNVKRESCLIPTNIPEVVAEDESEHNKSQIKEEKRKMFAMKALKLQSGKDLVNRNGNDFKPLSKKQSKSVLCSPHKALYIANTILKLDSEDQAVRKKLKNQLNTDEKCEMLDYNADSSISSSKSKVSNCQSENSEKASSSSSSFVKSSDKKSEINLNTENKLHDDIKPFDISELKKLNGGSGKSNWYVKQETLKDEPVLSTLDLKKVTINEEEKKYEVSPDKKSLSKLSKSPEDSLERNENNDDIDKLNTETAILNPSSNREILDDDCNAKIFVLDKFGTIDVDHNTKRGPDTGDDNILDIEVTDYHNVEGLDDEEEEESIKSKKQEKLNIETVLNRSLILKLVSLIMGIIILLQMTNPNYIQDLSSTSDTDKIDYCLNIFAISIGRIMNYTKSNGVVNINDGEILDPEIQNYLTSLNQTVTICFGYLKEIPVDFDAQSWNGRLLNSNEDSNASLVSLNDTELDADHLLFDFLLVNMTMCSECKLIEAYYGDYISFPNVASSEKYTNNHGMTLNIDYYYRAFPLNGSQSYIECLVDLHYVSFLDKLMNLLRSLFVTIVLILVSHMLNNDVKEKVVVMVLKLIKKFRYFFHSSSQDYFSLLINEEKNEDEMLLYRKLGMFSYFFDLSCGKRILGLVSQSDNNKFTLQCNFEKEGVRFQGTMMMIKFKTTNSQVNLFKYIKEINRIYTVIHSLAYCFSGEIINENKIIWKNKEELFDIDCLNYCRKIINNNCVNKLLNPRRVIKGSDESKDFQDRLDTNLALLCSAEMICTLSQKFGHSLQILSEGGIKLQIFLIKDDLLYGFIGNKEITVNQTIYSRKAKLTLDTMESETFSEMSVIITSGVYTELHNDLQILCFPYEINNSDIFYKLYFCSKKEEVASEGEEEFTISEEFCTEKIIDLCEQTKLIATSDFEMLIDLLYSNNDIAQEADHTLKSITKLAFHYIIENKLVKVLEILDDMFTILNEKEIYDKDFYFKMKQLKDKVQQLTYAHLQ